MKARLKKDFFQSKSNIDCSFIRANRFLENIQAIANKYKLKIIEDCARLGAVFNDGRKAGNLGDAGGLALPE